MTPTDQRNRLPFRASLVLATLLGIALSVAGVQTQGSASILGEWSAVFQMPLVAVHTAAVPTGELLMFDAWEFVGTPSARLWNPITNTYTLVPNTFSELFCAGQVVLSDGHVFTAGGHNGGGVGTRDVTDFDPRTRLWTQLADMTYARWYPSAIELLDGRILVLGGAISRPAIAEIPEIYDWPTNSWTPLTAAQKDVGEYPKMFETSPGRVLVMDEGPAKQTWFLDVDAQSWTSIGQSPAPGSGAIMYRPGRVLMAGGPSLGGDPVIDATGVLDLNAATPTWRATAPMAYSRALHNFVIMPDGKVLVVGGSTEVSLISTSGVMPSEIWDPATETWTTVAPIAIPRMYHSTAMLLPDGRVLSAGGGRLDPAIDHLDGQIYSPPYLFKGPRPVIASAPDTLAYGEPFTVGTLNAQDVARVTLVRTSSATHSINLEQRFIELEFARNGDSLTVTPPVSQGVAAPGYYMLFILDANDVPSVAHTVRLEGTFGGPNLTINDPNVVEGNTGTSNMVFSVSVSSHTQPVTVSYATEDGTAVAGVDYVATSGSLTFAPGVNSQTVSVPVLADWEIEPNETFNLHLSSPVDATIVDGTGTATIINDDSPVTPSISISNVNVTEGTGAGTPTASFTVTLSPASAANVTVNFTTVPGSALSPADFAATTGLLTFGSGTTLQTIQVPIVADATPEGTERFTVQLSNPVNATLANAVGEGSIIDDDAVSATFQIAADDDDVNEDGSTWEAGGSTLWFGTGASATASYAGLRFTNVTVPRGATIVSAQVEVQAANGQWNPIGFEFAAEASSNSAPFSAASRPSQRPLLAPRATHASDEQWLLDGWYALTVAGGHPGHDPGIAPLIEAVVAQPDWDAGHALALIARGQGNAWARKFARSAAAAPAQAPRLVVTYAGGIMPLPALRVSDVVVTEGTGGTTTANFVVTLPPGSAQTVTVAYATADGTATAGSDYTATSGTLTFGPETGSQTVSVPIVTDSASEPPEGFTLVLSNPVNATLGDPVGEATIIDDDGTTVLPAISIGDVSVNEAAAGTVSASFAITLDAVSPQPVSVSYATADNTATAGADYTAGSGTLTFAPGVTTLSVLVPIVGDAVAEPTETFNVVLSSPVNATLADGTGVGTIVDDDGAATIATFQVASSGDDVNEDGASFLPDDGTVWLGTGASATASYTGLRFTGVSIPQGATIVAARLEVQAASGQWNAIAFEAGAEASGNSAAFTAASRPSQRVLLAPRLSHSSNSQWVSGTWYELGDVQPLVQAVVNQPAWASGNALAVIVHGSGGAWARKFARSVEGGAAQAARLVVTYSGGGPPPLPTLSVADVTVNEAIAGGVASFVVTLSAASTDPVSVNFATADGTATAGSDYAAGSGAVHFAPGATTQTISVPIVNDSAIEANETFSVVLSQPTAATVADGVAVGTIVDDDAPPTLPVVSIGDVTATEGTGGAGTATFAVTLSASSTTPVTVTYTTADGTATAGSDYTAGSGTLTFAPGVTSLSVLVPIVGDAVPEPTETFNVVLSSPVNATLADGTGVGTIVDDDGAATIATFQIASGGDDVNEDGASFLPDDGTVWLGTGASAAASYTGLRFTGVSIPHGATIVAARLEVQAASGQWNAIAFEAGAEASGNSAAFTAASRPSQRVLLTPRVSHSSNSQWVSGAWYELGDVQPLVQAVVNQPTWASGNALAVIVHGSGGAWGRKFGRSVEGGAAQAARLVVTYSGGGPPPLPTLSVADVTVNEAVGSGVASFVVTLSAASTDPVSVSFATADGTATAGSDYAAGSGTVHFAPGVTTQTIGVPIVNDSEIEASETFSVALSQPTAATVADGAAVGTILDDDAPPLPSLTIGDVSVTEGTGTSTTANFPVTLSSPSLVTVTVQYASADGSATAGSDYTAASGTLTFAPGVTSQIVAVPIGTDAVGEPDETFTLALSNPANATIADGVGVATIVNDDAGPATATFQIAAAGDDVNQDGASFEADGGSVWAGTGATASASYLGLRFTGVSVPHGATIVSAWLEVNPGSTVWNAISFEFAAEAAGNSAAFSPSGLPSQRLLETPRVSHASNQQWVADTWYRLDDIGALVQAVVSRGDWSAGNALSLVVKGTGGAWGRKFVHSFEGDPTRAPRLVVVYSAPQQD